MALFDISLFNPNLFLDNYVIHFDKEALKKVPEFLKSCQKLNYINSPESNKSDYDISANLYQKMVSFANQTIKNMNDNYKQREAIDKFYYENRDYIFKLSETCSIICRMIEHDKLLEKMQILKKYYQNYHWIKTNIHYLASPINKTKRLIELQLHLTKIQETITLFNL